MSVCVCVCVCVVCVCVGVGVCGGEEGLCTHLECKNSSTNTCSEEKEYTSKYFGVMQKQLLLSLYAVSLKRLQEWGASFGVRLNNRLEWISASVQRVNGELQGQTLSKKELMTKPEVKSTQFQSLFPLDEATQKLLLQKLQSKEITMKDMHLMAKKV